MARPSERLRRSCTALRLTRRRCARTCEPGPSARCGGGDPVQDQANTSQPGPRPAPTISAIPRPPVRAAALSYDLIRAQVLERGRPHRYWPCAALSRRLVARIRPPAGGFTTQLDRITARALSPRAQFVGRLTERVGAIGRCAPGIVGPGRQLHVRDLRSSTTVGMESPPCSAAIVPEPTQQARRRPPRGWFQLCRKDTGPASPVR